MPVSPSASTASNGAAQSASNALAALRTHAKQSADDAGDDFASQLERAQPQPQQPTSASSKSDTDGTDKASSDDDKSGKDDKDKPAADSTPDAATLLQWAQQHLAQKADATPKGAAKPGGDSALGGLLASGRKGAADLGKGLPGAANDANNAQADANALAGKGSLSAKDAAAALGQDGAANSASQTKDSMAALLPQPDPVTVQAGAIGAAPTAVLDGKAAAEQAAAGTPAQASLPMAPQSPAFAPALGQQIAVWMKEGVQHAEVHLNPQDLGPIRVKIAVDGAATKVEMSADVASTRDALQQALPQLSDSLGQVGLSLTGGGVSDQSASQSQSQGQFQMAGDGGSGSSGGRQGGGNSGGSADDGLGDLARGAASRPASARRGLLDMYA